MNKLIEMNAYTKQRLIRLFTFLSVLICGFVILIKVDNMMSSFVLAFVISYMLAPMVNAFERAGTNRTGAILFTFTLLTFLAFVIGSIALPFITAQASSLKHELPKYINGISSLLTKVEVQLAGFIGSDTTDFNLGIRTQELLINNTRYVFEQLPNFLSRSFTVLLLAPFFAFFLLKDGRVFTQKLLSIAPNHLFEMILNLNHQINQQMGQFVRARLLEAAFVGSIVFAGLFSIGYPYATILSLFAALMNLVPYIGPIIGVVPALIIGFINGDSTMTMVIVSLIYGVAQLLDIIIIIPLVVAKIVNLHPITVVVSIIIGAQLLGVLGMIISIPVTSALKVTLTTIYRQALQE